jgi:hypothetical protein
MVNLRSTYFEIRCEASSCQETLRVEAKRDLQHKTQSLAQRARDALAANGWTQDSRGLDHCPVHSHINSF